jgi:hypothetical protein
MEYQQKIINKKPKRIDDIGIDQFKANVMNRNTLSLLENSQARLKLLKLVFHKFWGT